MSALTSKENEVPNDLSKYDLSKSYGLDKAFENLPVSSIAPLISQHLRTLVKESRIARHYEVILLFDEIGSIGPFHSETIFESVKGLKGKNILMILNSDGGKIEHAYKISETCKDHCREKFTVMIPRRAKSAATLLSLGASEIHMGSLSELGPIDSQVGGCPALALPVAVEVVAEIAQKYPGTYKMFAEYLYKEVDIRHLGLFERVNESAEHYAQRLLSKESLPEDQTPDRLAHHFVNAYKDHGFVINAHEATCLLGSKIIKQGTREYDLGDRIYEFLAKATRLFGLYHKKRMRYVGGIEDGLDLIDKDEKRPNKVSAINRGFKQRAQAYPEIG